VNKQQLAFLLAGIAFGTLLGYGWFNAMDKAPAEHAAVAPGPAAAPAGPRAPTQVGTSGAEGGAPMMREINALKQRVQDEPQDAEALARLANVYHEIGMWQQAVDWYVKALEVTPGDPDMLTDMGVCYRGLGEYDRALSLFDEAQALHPEHWESLFNTAVVAGFDLAQYDRALTALDALEQLNPEAPRLGELRAAIEQAQAGTPAAG